MAKGFAPWRPQTQTRKYLDEVIEVMEASRNDWPMTQRYWLYRLMSVKDWLKVDEYRPSKYKLKKRHLCTPGKNLNNILDRGRRAGFVPWEAVTSKRGEKETPINQTHPSDLADSVEVIIAFTQFDRQRDQSRNVVLWCETEGMVSTVWPVAEYYGATLLAGKGFDVIGSKYNFAKTVAALGDVLVLHLGDLDKSGHTVYTALIDDLNAFIEKLGGRMALKRIGLTEAQLTEYGLEFAAVRATSGLNAGNHGKGFDSEWECQLEAMESADVRSLVTTEFEKELDMDLFRARLEYEKTARIETASILVDRLGGDA